MNTEPTAAELHEKTLALNEALLLGSLRQSELTQEAERLNAQLRAEITERKQAEQQMKRALDFGRAVLESVPPLLILNHDLRVQKANESFYQTFRVTPAQTENRLVFELGNGQWNIPALHALLEDILPRSQIVKNYEVTHDFQNVGRLTMLVNACQVEELQTIVLSIGDITERKQAQRARAELGAIVESSEDAIIGKDLNGIITSWNKGAQRLFGYRAEEVIGRPTGPLIPAVDQDEEAILERLRQGERIQHSDVVRISQEGRPIDVSLTISPIRDDTGAIIGVSRIIRDITERKQIEGFLAGQREELERLVAERTAKLKETFEELEQFSYAIIHDMRAPLRAMQSYASMLAEEFAESLPPQGLDYSRRIQTGARRLDRLITDSLQYSQVLRQELPRETVALPTLLHGIIESYPNLQPPGAEIAVELGEVKVQGNEAALTQCFSNLLGNAVKFAKPGVRPHVRIWAESVQNPQPTVQSQTLLATQHATRNTQHVPLPLSTTPSLHHSTTPLPSVRIWVEDNGLGIPKEFQPRIFDMFQRGTNQQEGTGIGLAIVRKAVQRMGGQVGVASEPGKGSRFWLELPKA